MPASLTLKIPYPSTAVLVISIAALPAPETTTNLFPSEDPLTVTMLPLSVI